MAVLAQFDLVKPRYPKTDPRMSSFYESTRYVNNLAEQHPGFIWRELNEDQALLDELWGQGYLYTLSVWRSPESLKDFLYKTPHNEFRKRGAEWFLPVSKPRVVMWWIEEGHIPTLKEAHEKMQILYEVGPSYQAFDLKNSALPIVIY
ncbi:hypothetical protein C2E19_28880 [Pseudomonas sp. DTU12.3]|uniref:DUF3291 domain-containing protein n=1 Tax=Pseudomonas sp. DTU12.3 TaxID=2073078 RepID=UPI00101211C8|nr:DUF3291 domain-containing protein [Pseudomonas sp. DTU12.3]QAX87612.1 hypothetical protein C2E19_28880 [Pseudomonas sp. DTU12.3]